MSFKKLPGGLSFQRCLLASDALFFNLLDDGSTAPLHVIRHGIRGTQNVVKKSAKKEQAAAASATREEVSNIQTTDTAKLAPDAAKLRVRFELRFLDVAQALFACAPSKTDDPAELQRFRQALKDFIAKAKTGAGLQELARRYARNLANGRWLWRNRAAAAHVLVRITPAGEQPLTFNALDIPLNSFGNYSPDEEKVAAYIAKGLCGARDATLIIEADVDFGARGAIEVFPSQNYLEGKEKGFARPLYCVGDAEENHDKNSPKKLAQAALRDQKISNAIRTIDTWYPDFAARQIPLPVEPNGASLDAQLFFRNNADSGFKYMQQIDDLDAAMTPDSEKGMFLLACMIRGGVFSESA